MTTLRESFSGLIVIEYYPLSAIKSILKYLLAISLLMFTGYGFSEEQKNTINWGKWDSSQGVQYNDRNYKSYLHQLDGSFLQDYDEDALDEALEIKDYKLKGIEIELLDGL